MGYPAGLRDRIARQHCGMLCLPAKPERLISTRVSRNCNSIKSPHVKYFLFAYCLLITAQLKAQTGMPAARTAITKLAKTLDSTTRSEDPSRYTMLVNHGDFNRFKAVGLTDIPMIVGWNLYSGWYGGNLTDFPAFLERHHKELPTKALMVTEYGADADPRIRSLHPVRFEKSVEYTTAFHQYYLSEMMKRPFVAGAMLWNLADFNSETREETMPHINNKGLLTWDRTAKDPWFLYQASLHKEPFLKITSANWKLRGGLADSNTLVCYQPVQVAANLDSVELCMNGKSMGIKMIENSLAEWKVPFVNGENKIMVKGSKEGKAYIDQLDISFQLQPYQLNNEQLPFNQLNILLGADRYYIDERRQQIWLPDQPYRPGSWGHIGGKPFKIANGGRLPYGTDKNIVGTMMIPFTKPNKLP